MRKSGLASLAFFYFDFRHEEKRNRQGLLSSLLFQLCDQSDSYCDIFSDLYLKHNNGRQPPHETSLAQCLKNLLRSPGQAPVYLIFDALDESPNASGMPSSRENVLTIVKDLMGLRLPNLRICVTSRPEVDIQASLESLETHTISLHDEEGHKQDILRYIRTVVDSDPQMQKWRAKDKKRVIDALSQKANGM